jgi:hypothetical protein
MNINKISIGIIFLITVVASLSCVSAMGISMNGDTATVTEDDRIVSITMSNFELLSKYGDNAFRVNAKNPVTYQASAIEYTGTKLKAKTAVWDFGDGTKVKGLKVKHTYKKSGWYNITVTINATGSGSILDFGGDYKRLNYYDSKKTYRVYVDAKPDLTFTNITKQFDKKKNVRAITVVVKNIGGSTAKASYIKVSYPYKNKKLAKYTKVVKIPALKPGKSKKVNIYFVIPKAYSNLNKRIELDAGHKIKESIKSNNVVTFKN